MEIRKTSQAVFITIIFILASLQLAYAIGEDFSYDANGNMIQGSDGLYYEYNNANQLKRVHVGGPTGEVIAEYWYDYTGKRVKKEESGVITYYWFDNFEQIVYPNGTVVNITYYIANNERLAKKVSTAAGDKTYYFHPDHLGSTSIVSDEDGNLVEKTEYYPYGGVKQGGSEQYLFTGKELDKATGLYDYGARQYNSDLARFVQPDNIIQEPYDPQSLNRYAYTRNNPVKYTDPSGNVWTLVKTAAKVAFKGGNVGLAMQDFRDAGNAIVDAIKDPTRENIKNAAVKTFGAVVLSKGDIKEIKGGMSKLGGMGKYSKQAPGGGLAAHEARGGHLLQKHVGKSDEFLVNRMRTEGVSVSSFHNRAIAEQVASDTIKNNKKLINRWLQNPDAPLTQEFFYRGNEKIGKGIMKGDSQISDMTNARIVLKKTGKNDYIIYTGYPTK